MTKTVLVRSEPALAEAIHWTAGIFFNYINLPIERTDDAGVADLVIGHDPSFPVVTDRSFWEAVLREDYDTINPELKLQLLLQNGEPDYLATAFYFLNCLWERRSDAGTDSLARHEFEHSIWHRNKLAGPENVVNNCFDALASQLGLTVHRFPSWIHLSHDIDSVYGSFLQDGLAGVKKKRIKKLFRHVADHVRSGPAWMNFRTIARIELDRGYHSAFFWLVNKGKTAYGHSNADYRIDATAITREINWLAKNGFDNGLHKSISPESFGEELKKLPFHCELNRNHFLKFNFAELIRDLQPTTIKIDFSLGYAETFGYRNGYSLPFVPFDVRGNKPATFIEVPLAIMDGTFSRYKAMNATDAYVHISEFIKRNRYNSVISILWHNSHFTDLKFEGYPRLYADLLDLTKSMELKSLDSKEIMRIFG